MILKTKKRGFTLIELLVVISIIAMLSSIVLASMKTARDKAFDTSMYLFIRDVGVALYNCSGDGTVQIWASNVNGGGNICSNTSNENRVWPKPPNGFKYRQVDVFNDEYVWHLQILEITTAVSATNYACNAISCLKTKILNH